MKSEGTGAISSGGCDRTNHSLSNQTSMLFARRLRT